MPCLLIYGRSGVGKSMAIAKFLHSQPAVFDSGRGSTVMPVVAFQMPKEPIEEDFYEQMLGAVGISFKETMTKREASRLAMRMLRELGAKVLIIDEMNNLLAGTSRQQRLILNLIRFVTNELSMPIVCAGTPEAHARYCLINIWQIDLTRSSLRPGETRRLRFFCAASLPPARCDFHQTLRVGLSGLCNSAA